MMTLNGLPAALKHETVWIDASKFNDAERQYREYLAKKRETVKQEYQEYWVKEMEAIKQECNPDLDGKPASSIVVEIANAREKIKNMLTGETETPTYFLMDRLEALEVKNREVSQRLNDMSSKIDSLEKIINNFMTSMQAQKDKDSSCDSNIKITKNTYEDVSDDDEDDDNNIDLFGSDEETEEDARIKEERLKAYENKKSKKPALIAKSSVVLDVKPWDDETNMEQVEAAVRKISTDGLKWGAGKLVPLAYGVKKLQIVAVVEDDKVSIDWLQESIEENKDLVQSVDIAAFNKL